MWLGFINLALIFIGIFVFCCMIIPLKMRLERISNLPSEVIDHILSYLPIRDAARTSILSRKWRYKFAMLPHLVFDPHFLHTNINKLDKVVDHVLLSHIGTIHTFSVTHFNALANWDIDRWILVLSRSSIKEFILGIRTGDPCKMPTCFYSFHDVTLMDFYNCLISKPPSTFKGFRRLKSLCLQKVTFLCQDALETLIAGSPLLERLILNDCGGFNCLKINAPNLKYLDVDEDAFEKVRLDNTSLRADAVNVEERWLTDSFSNLAKYFASLSHVGKLEITRDLLKYFTAGDDLPAKLPTPFPNLCTLRLSIGFGNVKEILAALCLLRSSPDLQELTISAFQEDRPVAVEEGNNSLSDDNWTNCEFAKLQFVQITGISGVKAELDFIKFLLSSSPVLERMVVQPASVPGSQMLVKMLSQFKSASVITILDP